MHKRRLPETNQDCEARFLLRRNRWASIEFRRRYLRMEKIGEIEPELNDLVETGSSSRRAPGLAISWLQRLEDIAIRVGPR